MIFSTIEIRHPLPISLPIDILGTYTAKHKQRDNNKKFFKSKLWQKKLAQRKKEQEKQKRK